MNCEKCGEPDLDLDTMICDVCRWDSILDEYAPSDTDENATEQYTEDEDED